MALTSEQLATTLSEALFHYREVLTVREEERGKVLPLKGKLPATDEDDALQAEFHSQLEAINRFLGSVDDMVAALNNSGESKSMVKYQTQDCPKWLEPFTYLKDEPFINPFTGLIVEAPASPNTACSRPGPSTTAGPLNEIPPGFWDKYGPKCDSPIDENSDRVWKKMGTVSSGWKDEKAYSSESRVGESEADSRMDPYMMYRPMNGNFMRPRRTQITSTRFSDVKRENDASLPGGWVNSWANSTDEDFDEFFPKAVPVPGASTLSRTKLKLLSVNPWKTWGPRMQPSAAIPLDEMGVEKAGAKAVKKQNVKSKRPDKQWTAPDGQGIVGVVEKTVQFSSPPTHPIEIRDDGFQIYNEPAISPKINTTHSRPSTPKNSMSSSSSMKTSSSGVSSTLESELWEDNERRISDSELFENLSDIEEKNEKKKAPASHRGSEPEYAQSPRNNPIPDPSPVADHPLETPNSNRQGPAFPGGSSRSYGPRNNPDDQVAADGALAERLGQFQAEFQRPSDIFDDIEGQESASSHHMREQYQKDRELAEMIARGWDPDIDPETLKLIKELSEDSPQDFGRFMEGEAENEAFLANIANGSPQDIHVLQDWELAMQLAEDSPQDLEEHLRQIKEQEEYARLAQELWDEDIRRAQREEVERIAEEERRERMADCIACSEEGEKVRMAMLPCDHGYCTVCIRTAFEGALKEKKPFRCCNQVSIDSVETHFPEHFVRDYNDLILELATPNPIYCSARNCSKFIPPASIQGDLATCRTCGSNTCRHCKAPQHEGICSADEESTRVIELAKQKGWKPCPGCHNMIERNEGCLHMTCTRCRAEFCYNCGRSYDICKTTCNRS